MKNYVLLRALVLLWAENSKFSGLALALWTSLDPAASLVAYSSQDELIQRVRLAKEKNSFDT